MEGEVVVVFYWLEADGFAEEAEVVDWDGSGEEGCYRCLRRGNEWLLGIDGLSGVWVEWRWAGKWG